MHNNINFRSPAVTLIPSFLSNWYVVSTGRVIVPTGRYIVPTGRVIVATGRYVVPAVKARFGGNTKSKKIRNSMLKQEFLEFRISEAEGLHKGSQDAGDVENLLSWVLFLRLIDSSMSIRTKVDLGFTDCIKENKLGWDDSTFSVFTTNSEDVEGRPIFNRFAKTDSMKAMPLPLSGDYTSLSDHSDLDESQICDKSLKVNTNDFAFSDSSVKSLEHKPTDSTSCASTSSVSTSMNEAEIESNVRTPIKEPIIV
uniref:Ribonuclease H-like domain, reverse transcriptase, RNA-dependent DNA polymerase n=1 Tax=Tanacetum cinerariifolium TaxID=118510 RepID=A0A6L2MNX0_TANCI|nr:ribonuclease H-like domain, reverse transcriptase, RNA-dependent DNA polymerase [Tanacetum cinerariifolium]